MTQQLEEAIPLAKQFNEAHTKFMEWLANVEPELRPKELAGLEAESHIKVSSNYFLKL